MTLSPSRAALPEALNPLDANVGGQADADAAHHAAGQPAD
jgi:hypothetical protein